MQIQEKPKPPDTNNNPLNSYIINAKDYSYSTMYACKVFCPEAGPSLDMHYQGSSLQISVY